MAEEHAVADDEAHTFPVREGRLLIIGSFFEDLVLWQKILDDCATHGVFIVQHHLNYQGRWMYFYLQVSGDWHQLAKIEMSLKAAAKLLTTEMFEWRRETIEPDHGLCLPYVFEANCVMSTELYHLLIQFIRAEPRLEIKEIWTDRYYHSKTCIPLHKIKILVYISLDVNLPELRENFMMLCEQYNFDGMFELDKE